MPGYANPQNLNRYSYVTNNPLRYIDPTGHMLDYADGGGGGGSTLPSPPDNDYCDTHPLACGGGGGGGHDDDDIKPEPLLDNGDPECDPNEPGCTPIFSGTLSIEELLTLQTNLTNYQSILNMIMGGGYAFAGVAATAAGIAAFTGFGAPAVPGLLLVAGLSTLVATAAAYESAQLNSLISEVNTMLSLAASSPDQNINVYTYIDSDHNVPLPSLSYEGGSGVYTADSLFTIQLRLLFN